MQVSPNQQSAQGQQGLPPLPAINVHMFAETQAGRDLFQQVAGSRHFQRTTTQVFDGGIFAALQAYAQAPTPELLVVETTADRNGIMEQLAQLAQVVVRGTRVVVVGHINDVLLYRQLMAQGLQDYLAMPLSPGQLITSLASIFAGEQNAQIGRIATFLGAKGGVGSSVIAHNVSWLLSERYGQKTVVTDLDLAFGTAGLDFGHLPAQGVTEALASIDSLDPTKLDRLLHKCSEHLMLLASPGALDSVIPIQEQALSTMLDLLRQVVPMIVLDLPSDWDNWMRAALLQAEKVVITSTPELAALRNTKVLLDKIRNLRPNDEPPLLVLNQVGLGKRPEVPVNRFVEAVGATEFITIPFDEQSFGKAAMEGRMLLEEAPNSEAAKAIEDLAIRVSGLQPQQPAQQKRSPLKLLEDLKQQFLSRGKK